jgi:hypothetical protein
MTDTLPPFLYGCFDWRANGLWWDQTPPIDLLSVEALSSENPWVVLASATEHAKAGSHAEARHLVNFFGRDELFALSRVSMLVFGSIASFEDLPLLGPALNSDDIDTRCYAASAAALAGRLDLVPDMLQAWAKSETSRPLENIGIALSDLLEPVSGPILENMGWVDMSRGPARRTLRER